MAWICGQELECDNNHGIVCRRCLRNTYREVDELDYYIPKGEGGDNMRRKYSIQALEEMRSGVNAYALKSVLRECVNRELHIMMEKSKDTWLRKHVLQLYRKLREYWCVEAMDDEREEYEKLLDIIIKLAKGELGA